MDFFNNDIYRNWDIKNNDDYISNSWGIKYKYDANEKVRDIKTFESDCFTNVSEKNKMINFSISEEFKSDCLRNLSVKQKSMMYYYILKYKKDIVFLQQKKDMSYQCEKRCLYFEELEKEYPHTISQRILMVLENLANYSKYIGKKFHVGKEKREMESLKKIPWLFMPENDDIDEAWGMYQLLLGDDYLRIMNDSTSNNSSQAILTEKAWKFITRDIEKKGNKIFIAMSYNREHKSLIKYEDVVKTAISQCGYEPMIIKDKEHSGYIPLEIEYEISTSSALIADLTEQNNGVYFEAGYARGKNVPVIFTSEKIENNDSQKIHFDVAQINTIFWELKEDNLEELQKALERRILATLGPGDRK